ncbi:MAG TPA: hypothetical protein PKA05_22015 [Roseiflexaceae bacterium]|nr:hypothetical protein [Roseiflexaceae bacterium]HMP43066.1 hypothetical protein [Roseiflexaceae bacterium]
MSYLTIYPFIIGIAALAIGAGRRERMFRRKKAAQLTAEVQALSTEWFFVQQEQIALPDGVELEGGRMGVGVGTVGSKRGLDTLTTHARDGSADDFGSFGIFEADTRTRNTLRALVRTEHEDRMKYGHVHEYPNGFGNDPPATVEANVGKWGPEARRFVEQLIALHQERTKSNPGEILLFLSMGGHAYPGVFIAEELHQRLPGVPIFAVVNLPSNEAQREAFYTLKPRYEQAGVTGFLLGDQMERGAITQDSTIGELFAGFTAASVFSDLNSRFNNIANGIGQLVQFSYAFGEVVARPVQATPKTPTQYLVYRDEVKSETRRLVELIERGAGAPSVRGEINPERHQTYDLVLLALEPRDVRTIRDLVEEAREIEDEKHRGITRSHLHDKGNYRAIYAPWAQKVDPDHPRCQVAVIRLRSLRNQPGDVAELVKLPHCRTANQPNATGNRHGAASPAHPNGTLPADVLAQF